MTKTKYFLFYEKVLISSRKILWQSNNNGLMVFLWEGVGVFCLDLETDLTSLPIGVRDLTIPLLWYIRINSVSMESSYFEDQSMEPTLYLSRTF